jgi:hypothetical protein
MHEQSVSDHRAKQIAGLAKSPLPCFQEAAHDGWPGLKEPEKLAGL